MSLRIPMIAKKSNVLPMATSASKSRFCELGELKSSPTLSQVTGSASESRFSQNRNPMIHLEEITKSGISSGAANAARIETRFPKIMRTTKQPPNPLPAGFACPGLTGSGFGGFLRPMKTEAEKQKILAAVSRALDAQGHPLIHLGFALEFIAIMIEASEQHAAGEIQSVDLCDISSQLAGEATGAIYGFALRPLPTEKMD